MSRKPELPDFIRDLEIEQSLKQVSPRNGNVDISDGMNDCEDPTA